MAKLHVNLGIEEYDWSELFTRLDNGLARIKAGEKLETEEMDQATLRSAPMFTRYKLETGELLGTDKEYYKWASLDGESVRSVPIAQRITRIFAHLGIYVRPLILRLDGHGTRHKDLDSNCCGLNLYPTDRLSITIIEDIDGREEHYHTIANNIQLIDNTKWHRIENIDIFHWFHVRIYADYNFARRVLEMEL